MKPIVAEFAMPDVNLRHLANIFADLDDSIQGRLGELRRERQLPFHKSLASVLEAFAKRGSGPAYRDFQRKWLVPRALSEDGQALKFLDAPFWIEGKLRTAWRLGLHCSAPIAILDIGMGCGHFSTVGEFFGHRAMGLDLPAETSPLNEYYADYRRVMRLNWRPQTIRAMKPLEFPHHGERYDLVVGLLTNFNCDPLKGPWEPQEWEFFLDDIGRNFVRPGGRIFLQLTRLLTGSLSWAYLKGRSSWSLDLAMQALIKF